VSERLAASGERDSEPAARRVQPAARQRWWRRFHARGVFWRQLLRWAILTVPVWIEPAVIAWWSAFFLFWGPGRRGVMRNLKAIKPGSIALANFFRCYRVFWNFAWTMTDNVRFKELRVIPDWEFTGYEHFEAIQASGGAILLTAHMGSYDLGANLFAEKSGHHIIVVRAPEIDPRTRAFEEKHGAKELQIEFNVSAGDLALDLLHTVREGGIVAIQGDRVTEGIANLPATLFGKATRLPAGPFALAMAARVPIHPMFVVRVGRRRYRVVAFPPIVIAPNRDRDSAFAAALQTWTRELEDVIRTWWYQWFMFEPFSPELG
jgi:predicted LPLAT superfamily acyltransferase